ncbi:MAG TPA: hypothetical protein VGJ94_06710 [Syntrophorhabdaceae bacterium]|jgi:hypothetical protein
MMKKTFTSLLFIVLLATTILGYAVAQRAVDPRMIDMEKRRLEEIKTRLETSSSSYRSGTNRRQQSQSREDRIAAVQRQIDELDRDPEYYFYKK